MPNRLLALAAFCAGCVAALGFAPLDLWPLGLAAVAVLLWLVANSRGMVAAGLAGWLFGFGMFAVSLNWIATAFTFQAKMPAAIGWVAVLGLSVYLGLFVAAPAGLARALFGRPATRVMGMVAMWLPAEWLRGVALTGFAWNPLGALWLPVGGISQLAALCGGIGLSLLALLAAAGLLWLVLGPGRLQRVTGGSMLVLLLLAGLAGNGLVKASGFLGPSLVVVQPGIGQGERYAATADQHLERYLALTRAALARVEANARANIPDASIKGTLDQPAALPGSPLSTDAEGGLRNNLAPGAPPPVAAAPQAAGQQDTTPTLVLWPEGAIDGLVERDPALRARLSGVLRPGDLLLAGGTGVSGNGAAARYANSLFVINAQGTVIGRYDKAHLVPLGEYVPWRSLLEPLGIARLVPGDEDFAAGSGARSLDLPGFLPVSPVICYEIIFPQAVVDETRRPAWIANVSNDAWFGSWGPPQHLAQARLRAIEEGLPIVRATPTGISAVIDANGQLENILPANAADTILATLPPPLPLPLFARLGPVLALLAGLALAGLAFGLDRFRLVDPASDPSMGEII